MNGKHEKEHKDCERLKPRCRNRLRDRQLRSFLSRSDIGYMIPQIMSGNLTAVAWKLAAGLGYGAVLGLLRLKTKNCYSTMLLHGVLNIFMV